MSEKNPGVEAGFPTSGGAPGSFDSLAGDFLSLLDGGLRQAQLYERGNRLLTEQTQKIAERAGGLLRENPTFTFQGRESSVFVNDRRLRCDGATFLRYRAFLDYLAARGIDGAALYEPLEASEWLEVLLAVSRHPGKSQQPFEDVAAALAPLELEGRLEFFPRGGRVLVHRTSNVIRDRRSFSVRAYAKTMVLLRLYFEKLDDVTRRSFYQLKLQRSIQDLVTVCLQGGWRSFGLVNGARYEEHLYHHSTNVAVLSLVLGVRLGLNRTRLTELGMAAVQHQLGKAQLPKGLLEKEGVFTEEERSLVGRHPLLGVNALLKVRQYNESYFKRIRVLCESHLLPHGTESHPYSRIVGVTEVFDSMVNRPPGRPSFLPDDAIRMLIPLAGRRVERNMTHLFIQTVGLYPCGTVLELETGEIAIAMEPHPSPKRGDTPLALIVRNVHGKDVELPQRVDLSERTVEGELVRPIRHSVDPASVGVDVGRCLYEASQNTPEPTRAR